MLAWMLWATGVALVLGFAAHAGERALMESRRPGRWAWVVALGATVALPTWRYLVPTPSPARPFAGGAFGSLDPSWILGLEALSSSGPTLVARIEPFLMVLWVVAATVLTGSLVGGLVSLRRRAASWERARVGDDEVLVSSDFGPALVGVWSPAIVVPRWALGLPESDLRLACAHEAEHRRAHDTWLLFGAALAVSLMPWNLGLWWQVSRLRGAVEVDCDARVLRGGASRRAYAALLLALGTDRSRLEFPVLALARPISLLERRLKMIVKDVRDGNGIRALGAAAVAALLTVAACEAPAPTHPATQDATAGENAGTISRVEVREAPFDQLDVPAGTRFFVDGDEVSGLSHVDPTNVDRVEVLKPTDARVGRVQVFTKRHPEDPALVGTSSEGGAQVRVRGQSGAESATVYVDDVLYAGSLDDLDPATIERVEVVKGAEGATIHITLKPVAGTVTRR